MPGFPVHYQLLENNLKMNQFSSVQLLSQVQLFTTTLTAACQASLSITNSRSMLRLMSIKFVKPSNHLTSAIPFSSCLQSSPALGSFPMSQFFASGGQSTGASTSASVLPMNVQDWFLLKRGAFLVLLRAALCWVRPHMLFHTGMLRGSGEGQWWEENQRLIQALTFLCTSVSPLTPAPKVIFTFLPLTRNV